MSDRDEPPESGRDSDADSEDRPKGKFANFVGKDATDPAESEPILRWGRVVAGLFFAVLGVLSLLAAIPLFIWALTVEEFCMYECNPVPAQGRLFVGFVGGVLVAVGLALLAGTSRLLYLKSPPPD